MGTTPEEKKVNRGGAPLAMEPIALPIPQALAVLGLSRSGLYRAAAEGRIVLRKIGRSTIVDMASARTYIASLPVAVIGVARQAAATNATSANE